MTSEHPLYTEKPELACNAVTWGETHYCSCVYRITACTATENGVEHLCMCGNTWWTGACSCPNTEKVTTTMSVPVTTNINITQGDFSIEVTINAMSAAAPGNVAAVQLQRAAKAAAVLLKDEVSVTSDMEDPFEVPGF